MCQTSPAHEENVSGGRIPGVTVDVKSSTPTRTVASVVTKEGGAFHVASLTPGNYVVEFLLAGFTQSASFSNAQLTELPSASRNCPTCTSLDSKAVGAG